jgi:hypothetical protein
LSTNIRISPPDVGAGDFGRIGLVWCLVVCLSAGMLRAQTIEAHRKAHPTLERAGGPTLIRDTPPQRKSETGAKGGHSSLTSDQIRTALTKAIAPLQHSLVIYAEKRDCFSCHHQTVPLIALKIARSRGLAIDEDAFQQAIALTISDLESARDQYRKGEGQPGGVTREGYALWALEIGGHTTDANTNAVTGYLLEVDKKHDHWTTGSGRVPMEASHFTTTALTLRGLRAYRNAEEGKERIAKARAWLSTTKPTDTEDRVFRLWGLKYAGASSPEIEAATNDLQATQRSDGGWSQTGALASDAYATGSALVALHQAGGLATDDPAYQRGISFLLSDQKPDGTWFVHSRSKPFQPYFESGFPYGKDQFIAVAASGWAATALGLALPPHP